MMKPTRILAGLLFIIHCLSTPTDLAAETHRLPYYNLSIRVLPDAHRLEVTGTLLLPAADAPRRELVLVLSEQVHSFQAEILQPVTNSGVPTWTKEDQPGTQLGWGHSRFTIRPVHPVPPHKPVLMKFTYTMGGRISFVYYLGPEGGFAHGADTAWFPWVPGANATGIGMLDFSVPAGYSLVATGDRQSTAEEERRGHFKYEVTQPTSFSFAAGKYTIHRHNGKVPVSVYLLRSRENIDEYVEGCSKIIAFLSAQFGPYPYKEFVLAEIPPDPAEKAGTSGAGMEGFIIVEGGFLDRKFNLAFYGHEIGHQWWGNLIKKRGPRGNRMLSEAMAQFGALLLVEAFDGPAAAERFRRTGYPGYNLDQSGLGYLMLAAAGHDHPLGDLPSGVEFDDVANSKGFLVLDLLSHTVGREKFRAILNQFTQQHAFQFVTWEQFLSALKEGARQDLRWFYDQWFERAGAPDWHCSWTQKGRTLRGQVSQLPPFYQATVDLQATGDNGKHAERKLKIRGARTEFVWPLAFRARSVVIDPHFQVLHWTDEYRAQARALIPFVQARLKHSQGRFAEAHEQYKTALGQVPVPDLYGLRFRIEYTWATLFIRENKRAEAKAHLEAALASPARPAEIVPWVYFYLAKIAKDSQDATQLRWAVDASVSADKLVGEKTGATGAARALLRETTNPRSP